MRLITKPRPSDFSFGILAVFVVAVLFLEMIMHCWLGEPVGLVSVGMRLKGEEVKEVSG